MIVFKICTHLSSKKLNQCQLKAEARVGFTRTIQNRSWQQFQSRCWRQQALPGALFSCLWDNLCLVWPPCISHICHFFTQAKFLDNRIYTEKRVNYDKLHSKLPIFCVKSVKIYTSQKKFTRAPPVAPVTNMRYAVISWYELDPHVRCAFGNVSNSPWAARN